MSNTYNINNFYAGAPPGSVCFYTGTTIINGWLFCDGSAISKATNPEYTNLHSVIGTNYGTASGGSTFNLPDFRGYYLRGADSTSTAPTNSEFGASTVTLTTSNLTNHSHTLPANTGNASADHSHEKGCGSIDDGNCTGNNNQPPICDSPNAGASFSTGGVNNAPANFNHYHNFTTEGTGSGTAITLGPSSVIINYIIKY